MFKHFTAKGMQSSTSKLSKPLYYTDVMSD